jgi:anti-sigma factor RsiW
MSNLTPHHSDPFSSKNPAGSTDTIHRDRFELLSAYMDGEVTADERRQVEGWLATDANMQRLHNRMLNLRQAFQSMPVPSSDQASVQQTVDAVLAKVDRRSPGRWVWGGIAAAAVGLAAVGAMVMGDRSLMPQLANRSNTSDTTSQPAPDAVESAPMLVALDKPLVSIPKEPVAEPTNAVPLPNDNGNVR